jgi:hypothetical protein
MAKTYNSGYSLVVTHLTTNPPVRCLNRAERTGSLVVSCPVATNALKFPVYGKWVSGTRKQDSGVTEFVAASSLDASNNQANVQQIIRANKHAMHIYLLSAHNARCSLVHHFAVSRDKVTNKCEQPRGHSTDPCHELGG